MDALLLKPACLAPSWTRRVHTLQEAAEAAHEAALYFAHPERVHCGLHELLLNAVEHGNLSISCEEKTELIRRGDWLDEIDRRLSLPDYALRDAKISVWAAAEVRYALIADSGAGFDWMPYILRAPSPHRSHGYGIPIALSSFGRLEYLAPGNAVMAYE